MNRGSETATPNDQKHGLISFPAAIDTNDQTWWIKAIPKGNLSFPKHSTLLQIDNLPIQIDYLSIQIEYLPIQIKYLTIQIEYIPIQIEYPPFPKKNIPLPKNYILRHLLPILGYGKKKDEYARHIRLFSFEQRPVLFPNTPFFVYSE